MKTKRIIPCLLAALMGAMPVAAKADGRDWHRDMRYERHDRGWHDRGWHGDRVGWAILGAATTAAVLYAATRPVVYHAPPVAYVEAPPVMVPPPPARATWYFCPAAGQYYPYVANCPSGWQAVPATP